MDFKALIVTIMMMLAIAVGVQGQCRTDRFGRVRGCNSGKSHNLKLN